MKRSEFGGLATTLNRIFVGLIICALLGVVGYLLSNINQHRYRLAMAGSNVVVERGLFAPYGFAAYVPADDVERQAYAPIPVPPGEVVEVGVVFDDRNQVDRALYGRLAQWAQIRLQAPDTPTLELGVHYVKRLEILPSLSEGQRHELRGMRADAALRQGESLLRGVALALRQAQALFEQALELGTSHTDKARRGLADIAQKLSQLELQADPREAEGPATLPATLGTPALTPPTLNTP